MRLVTVARKPCSEGSTTANVVRHGTGALNVDACRIEFTDAPDMGRRQPNFDNMGYQGMRSPSESVALYKEGGRWPANVLVGADPVAASLDAQSGTTTSGPLKPVDATNWKSKPFDDGRGWNSHAMHGAGQVAPQGYGDTGGASRFFKQVGA